MFKILQGEHFRSGSGRRFYDDEVTSKGYLRGCGCKVAVRPLVYVMDGTAGLYYVATHVAVVPAAAHDIDSVFPDDLLRQGALRGRRG
jgi:hypothetical protein